MKKYLLLITSIITCLVFVVSALMVVRYFSYQDSWGLDSTIKEIQNEIYAKDLEIASKEQELNEISENKKESFEILMVWQKELDKVKKN